MDGWAAIGTEMRNWDESVLFPSSQPPRLDSASPWPFYFRPRVSCAWDWCGLWAAWQRNTPRPRHRFTAQVRLTTHKTQPEPLDTCTVSPPHDCRFAVSLSCVDFIRVTYEKRKMIDRSDASHNFARLIAATLIPGLELRQPVCYQRTRRRTDEPAGPEEPAGPLVDGRHAAFLDGH